MTVYIVIEATKGDWGAADLARGIVSERPRRARANCGFSRGSGNSMLPARVDPDPAKPDVRHLLRSTQCAKIGYGCPVVRLSGKNAANESDGQ
jgi:hypothetical protein